MAANRVIENHDELTGLAVVGDVGIPGTSRIGSDRLEAGTRGEASSWIPGHRTCQQPTAQKIGVFKRDYDDLCGRKPGFIGGQNTRAG